MGGALAADQRSDDARLTAIEEIVGQFREDVEQLRKDVAGLSERLAQATSVEVILERAHKRAACPQGDMP